MSPSLIVAAFRVVLIAVNVWWALYLIVLPAAEFATSPVWREALRVVPGNSPDVLGLAFLAGPVLAAASSFYTSTHLAGRVGYVAASLGIGLVGACWGLLGVSYVVAAVELRGQGAGSAGLSFGLVVLHGLIAFEHRAGHRLDEPRTGRR